MKQPLSLPLDKTAALFIDLQEEHRQDQRLLAVEFDGSHRVLSRDGCPDYVFAFHDRDEIGPRMLARIAKHTGLKLGDL